MARRLRRRVDPRRYAGEGRQDQRIRWSGALGAAVCRRCDLRARNGSDSRPVGCLTHPSFALHRSLGEVGDLILPRPARFSKEATSLRASVLANNKGAKSRGRGREGKPSTSNPQHHRIRWPRQITDEVDRLSFGIRRRDHLPDGI
jgi:hypothetical protein